MIRKQRRQIAGCSSAASSEIDPEWCRVQYSDVDLLKVYFATYHVLFGKAIRRQRKHIAQGDKAIKAEIAMKYVAEHLNLSCSI